MTPDVSDKITDEVKKAFRFSSRKIRTRVPDDDRWMSKKVLTARSAVVACTICRNQLTRGLQDLSDQMEGMVNIGDGMIQASIAIVRGPTFRPAGPARIQVPNGKDGVSEMTIGANTLILSETELGKSVGELARTTPTDFLRIISNGIRQKTSDCCKQNVWDRVLSQENKRRTEHVTHRRTREVPYKIIPKKP